VIAGAKSRERLQLRLFGRLVGMAFQIKDDVLDLTASSSIMGKAIGADLRNGVDTLPAIYGLSAADVRRGRRGKRSDESASSACATARCRTDPVCRASRIAGRYVSQALQALAPFPESEFKTSLAQLALFSVSRTS